MGHQFFFRGNGRQNMAWLQISLEIWRQSAYTLQHMIRLFKSYPEGITMNFKRLFLGLAATLCAIALSFGAMAQTTSTFTGNIDGTEPESFEVDNSSCTVVEPLLHYYEQFPVTVSQSGEYTYEDQSIFFALDMQMTVYENSYDPSDVLINCVTRMDDLGTVDLTVGQQYVLVVQPLFDVGSSGSNTGDWEFDLTGPGEVVEGTIAPIEPATPVPTLSAWALLLLVMTMLGGATMVLIRR